MSIGLLAGCGPIETSSTTGDPTTNTGTETGTETSTGTETDTGTGTETDTGGTTATTPPNPCLGEPKEETTNEECVVFAQADAPSSPGDGTRDNPFTSLQQAIDTAAAAGKRVFACTNEKFYESVVISAPIEVWGGFDCAQGWTYSPTARSRLEALPDTIGLTLAKGASGALVVGWQIDALDATTPGKSATAVAIDVVEVQTALWRCDLFAGEGGAGKDGDSWLVPAKAGVDAPAPGAVDGATGACVAVADVAGGKGGVTACADGDSVGGNGGLGGMPPSGFGGEGVDGEPLPPSPFFGQGGKGETANAACTLGFDGIQGLPSQNGQGAKAAGSMTMNGVVTTSGTAGKPGGRGQGGGGGGGAKAGNFCPGGTPGAGPAGGGGGSGGCGGLGGNAGQGGGSSIGLIMMGGPVYFSQVTITTSTGGKGGNGSEGQLGGKGGKGADGGAKSASGLSNGCEGGNGGEGAQGGRGGGGRGGDSVCIGYMKDLPTYDDYECFYGVAGEGGNSGPVDPQETAAANGQIGNQRTFYKPPN